MRVLIIGCGYVGLPLGRELVRQGHQVFGLRRSPHSDGTREAASIVPVSGDVSNPEDMARLPAPFDWIVNTVSSSKGGVEDYRRVYLEGTRVVLERFRADPPRKYVYTSSTGVYEQNDRSIVKESSPAEPASEAGKILLETEKLLLEARNFPAVILRVAGIYGPGRGYHFQQFLRGEASIPGRGERFLNMIHVDDVVGAIIAALNNGRPGEIYNASDDEPVPQIHFFRWLSETLGLPMPPFVAESEIATSKRAATNKRVLNRKLKVELGYSFKYPTFRQGYTAEITRLQQAGLFDLKLGPGADPALGHEPKL
jgi:nucleoside-diphosphate-sugar epimerase